VPWQAVSDFAMSKYAFAIEVGVKIAEARRAKGLTQKEVADHLGFRNHTSVASWESGRYTISLHDAVLLCEYLDVTVPWLVSETVRLVKRGEND
jgi:transcriptional regulator with XRE-family HTH domain